MIWMLTQLDLHHCHLSWSSWGPSSPGLARHACLARLTYKSSIILPGGLVSAGFWP